MRSEGKLAKVGGKAVPELAWRRVGLLPAEAVAQVAYPRRAR